MAPSHHPYSQMLGRFRVDLPKDAEPGPHGYIAPLPQPFPHEQRVLPLPQHGLHYSYTGRDGVDMITALHAQARMIATPSGSRISPLQRCLLQMVFDMVTPYPDHVWSSMLAIAAERYVRLLPVCLKHLADKLFACRTKKQLSNIFKKKRDSYGDGTSCSIDDPAVLVPVWCSGRQVHVRRRIFHYCPPNLWSDDYFRALISSHMMNLMAWHEQQFPGNETCFNTTTTFHS
jgi:hypothetical protein